LRRIAAHVLVLHAKFPGLVISLLFTTGSIDFAGEFRCEQIEQRAKSIARPLPPSPLEYFASGVDDRKPDTGLDCFHHGGIGPAKHGGSTMISPVK